MAGTKTWGGMRKKLEKDYLCPALRGHIQYYVTSYDDGAGHGRAAIRLDGVEILRSDYYAYTDELWKRYNHLRSTTMVDRDSAKEAIDLAHANALDRGTFDQMVFYDAFSIFDNQSIEKSVVSENPLVRIFALLDRRLGKRRLLEMENSMERELHWVRMFYVIRMRAEGLLGGNDIPEEPRCHKSHPFIFSRRTGGRNCPTATAPARFTWPYGTGASANWIWMSVSPPPRPRTPWTALYWMESWRLPC